MLGILLVKNLTKNTQIYGKLQGKMMAAFNWANISFRKIDDMATEQRYGKVNFINRIRYKFHVYYINKRHRIKLFFNRLWQKHTGTIRLTHTAIQCHACGKFYHAGQIKAFIDLCDHDSTGLCSNSEVIYGMVTEGNEFISFRELRLRHIEGSKYCDFNYKQYNGPPHEFSFIKVR